jgi:hypothetical protein
MTAVLVPDDFRALTEPLEVELDVGGARVTVRLAVDSVDALPAHRLRAEPFSLLLRGPRDPSLPQATYTLRHPRLGTIQLFLVPLERGAQDTRYEVLFN